MHHLSAIAFCSLLALSACGSDGGGGDSPDAGPSAPQLGNGDNSASSVTFTVIANAANGLDQPRDLAFNPMKPNELWIVNFADDSTLIVPDAPSEVRSYIKRIDGYALHFMEEVTAIDFGQNETTIGVDGTFATCGESRNTYNGQAPGNDFTGPSLWSSDLSVYAAQNPHGLGSHLDMLHNTPLCMGIAHETGNRYWTVGGLHKSIDLYDFELDDGIGNDDHLDGKTWRYATGEIGYEPGVGSHLALDSTTKMLYIADPANGRVVRLDTASGTEGQLQQGLETPVQIMEGAILGDFVNDVEILEKPSGIELFSDLLFVSDNATGTLLAFDLQGNLVNHLETGLSSGSLGGFTFGPDGKLYFVDTAGNQVLRVDVPPQAP